MQGCGFLRKHKPMSFDDLLLELQGQKTNQAMQDQQSLSHLFNERFMSKHSGFKSFAEFLEKGNFQAETREQLSALEGELFDRHVARETDFADWQTMLDAATTESNA